MSDTSDTSTVLVVGSGGREHALAWALARSPRVGRLLVTPGNPGTALRGRAENVPLAADDVEGLVSLCLSESVGLAAIGPENALAAGLVDALEAAGIAAFGPTSSCARLESSKAYCKRFLDDNGIPTARARVFRNADAALAHLDSLPELPVVKASGLAAGKGVIVPESREEAAGAIRSMLLDGRFGRAGDEILLEERLRGTEVSMLAFCDGESFTMLPSAQDHKRLLEGDAGPNTGGMGAVAPSPVVDDRLIKQVGQRVIGPTLDALRRAGTPYRGVLYAGLMITGDGPKVLEFNCRFGDPEAQAVIRLLRSDLFEIMSACASGSLRSVEVEWLSAACAAVVMASSGYPASGSDPVPISGLAAAADLGTPGCSAIESDSSDHSVSGLAAAAEEDCVVFHAGTDLIDGVLHATGGRVLTVTALGSDLAEASDRARRGVAAITFEGAQYRSDIGPGGGTQT